MISNKLFKKFCKERNIKNSTSKGYASSIKHFTSFNNKPIEKLIKEALTEEEKNIPQKDRKIKKILIKYRNHLLESNMSTNTAKTYFTRIKTFYSHFEVEIPKLPTPKYNKEYETSYFDLPTKEHIKQALNISTSEMKAVILFMSSSGTSKKETLSLTINDFIKATSSYHNEDSIEQVISKLDKKDNIIPTFYLKRVKTDKYYHTFCSPEATIAIIEYLKTRPNLKKQDKLFDLTNSLLMTRFQAINDHMDWGFKGKYRFFRSHTLRKFHASNIGLSAENVDALQGRSKSQVHEAYIKTNPKKLKELYIKAMKNVMINNPEDMDEKPIKQEISININIFLAGKEYNIL